MPIKYFKFECQIPKIFNKKKIRETKKDEMKLMIFIYNKKNI